MTDLDVSRDPDQRPRATGGRSVCSVDGCGRPVEGHGWCRRHYLRDRSHGDPLAGGAYQSPPLLFDPAPWMEHAACRDLDRDLFFPQAGHMANKAKKVCATCPVIAECLAYAMTARQQQGELQGIWAGTSVRDRRKLAKQERIGAMTDTDTQAGAEQWQSGPVCPRCWRPLNGSPHCPYCTR